MPFSTPSLARHFTSHMADAPIGFVISTTGSGASAYVYANAAYLDMCGFEWSDIAGRDLVRTGAALISTRRQRRLWLLEHVGRYQNETATVRHASGQSLVVTLSARRALIEGRSVDLEYFSLLTAASKSADGAAFAPPALEARHDTSARMKAPFARVLSTMPEAEARMLVETMLNTVSRGLLSLAQSLPPQHPIARLALHDGQSAFAPSAALKRADLAGEADAEGSLAVCGRRLLNLATAIWMLAQSQAAETRARLIALVEPYTVPPDSAVPLAGGWPQGLAYKTIH